MMDFITWPELAVATGVVIAVFVAISGLMILVAAELTEQGPWFLTGLVVPAILLGVSFWVAPAVQMILAGAALIFGVGAPLVLAAKRPGDCLRSVAGGLGLLMVGTAGVWAGIFVHYQYFVR